jgi:DNA-binding Lrp family transcriptional regulator
MDWEKKARQLAAEGSLLDIMAIQKRLGVSRRTAINYVHELRKEGLVETTRGRNGIRLYRIRFLGTRERGHPGLYETINRYSPVKLAEPFAHRVYDHELTPEEAIARAVSTGEFRVILASLALFRKVSDWSLLYAFAKKNGIQRFVGALYDVSRVCMRVRRMDKRIRNMMKSSAVKTKYMVSGARSKDFLGIEREWGVFVPFNKSDVEIYLK